MPNFKPKKIVKKINLIEISESLDCKHEQFLKEFQNEKNNIIPQLTRKTITNYKLNLNLELNNFDEKLEIKDKIKEIDAKIQKLKKNKKDYLLNNSEYIFDYFEDKKKISEGSSSNTKLDQFFNIKDVSEIIPQKNHYNKCTKIFLVMLILLI